MSPHHPRRAKTRDEHAFWLVADACRSAATAVNHDTLVKCAARRHILFAATVNRQPPPDPPNGRHTA